MMNSFSEAPALWCRIYCRWQRSIILLSFCSPSSDEFDLITQRLSSLMEEGRGEAIYDVGVPLVDSDENGTAG